MTLKKISDGIYVDDSKIKILEKIDAVIFDCDGVLIDITKSYDLAIIKTTQHVLKHFAKIDNPIDVDFKIIDGFKSTGGFNDEVDLTYAAILSIVAAKKLEKDQTSFIFDVIENSDSSGIISVEKYIENILGKNTFLPDGASKRDSQPHSHFGNRSIGHWQDPGQPNIDDVNVVIWRISKVIGRRREELGCRLQLHMAFKTNNGFKGFGRYHFYASLHLSWSSNSCSPSPTSCSTLRLASLGIVNRLLAT